MSTSNARRDSELPTDDSTSPAQKSGDCIGVVGLGHMGEALALALMAQGHRVLAHDRDLRRVDILTAYGAEPAYSIAALSHCSMVFTSLPNDTVVGSVTLFAGGLVDVLGHGAIHISTSTISPDLARRAARYHEDHDQCFVSAPILGNPELARAKRIFLLAAGSTDALGRSRPVLEQLAERVFDLGSDPGRANLMKLACNVLTASTLQSMGEVFALLNKGGIDPAQAFEMFTHSLFDGRVHKAYGSKIVERRYSPPGMAVPLAVKDLRLALGEAEALAVPMPVAGVVYNRLVALLAAGCGDLDWSALGALAARDAGLDTLPDMEVR